MSSGAHTDLFSHSPMPLPSPAACCGILYVVFCVLACVLLIEGCRISVAEQVVHCGLVAGCRLQIFAYILRAVVYALQVADLEHEIWVLGMQYGLGGPLRRWAGPLRSAAVGRTAPQPDFTSRIKSRLSKPLLQLVQPLLHMFIHLSCS